MSNDPKEGTRTLTELLTRLVQSLVDQPEAVRVTAIDGTQSTIFEVSVAPPDVRRVIGRRGRTADALRELIANWGGKAERKLLLEVMEPTHRQEEIPNSVSQGVPVKVERQTSEHNTSKDGD